MTMRKRILVGAVLHETNTFNTVPTRLADFAGRYLLFGTEAAREQLVGTGTEIGGYLDAGAARGWEMVVTVAAACGPSGPLAASDWVVLKSALIDVEGRFDGVALALHGAMVTQDNLDPEGELLQALRTRHGPSVPIVATLDMHANVSEAMLAAADALFPYRTYPHIDHADCAADAAAALALLMDESQRSGGNRRLTRSILVRPPMLDAADHGRTDPPGPMNGLLVRASEISSQPGIISAGLTIGFPWADVPDAGPAVIVSALTTSSTDPRAPALELGHQLWESRSQTQLDFLDAAEAMTLAVQESGDARPLVLADFGDNPAAGAYGDSPNLLRAMIEARLENAVFASLADPCSVRLAAEAGEGAVLDLALGGIHTPDIAPPLHATVKVLRLHDGHFECEGPMLRGVKVAMGPMALVETGGIRILLASRALAVTDLNLLRAVDIEPASLRTIGLKSRNHLRAAFGPIARAIVLVDAGGIATMRLQQIPYRRIGRSVWPLSPIESSHKLEHTHVFDTAP